MLYSVEDRQVLRIHGKHSFHVLSFARDCLLPCTQEVMRLSRLLSSALASVVRYVVDDDDDEDDDDRRATASRRTIVLLDQR